MGGGAIDCELGGGSGKSCQLFQREGELSAVSRFGGRGRAVGCLAEGELSTVNRSGGWTETVNCQLVGGVGRAVSWSGGRGRAGSFSPKGLAFLLSGGIISVPLPGYGCAGGRSLAEGNDGCSFPRRLA